MTVPTVADTLCALCIDRPNQSFASDSKLTPFLAQYRGLSHLWLAVEAHCFSSGSSTLLLLRHASESSKSFRSALIQPDAPTLAVEARTNAPVAATNRQAKEKAPPKRPARATKAAVLATPAAKGRPLKSAWLLNPDFIQTLVPPCR